MRKKLKDRGLFVVTEEFLTKMNTNESRIKKLLKYASKKDREFITKRLRTMPAHYYKEDKPSQIMTIAFGLLVAQQILNLIDRTKENMISHSKYLKGEPLDEPSNEKI